MNFFFVFFFFFYNKIAIHLSLGRHKEWASYRRSLIQHFKSRNFWTFFYFCGSFLPSWIRIRIPNPDPTGWILVRTLVPIPTIIICQTMPLTKFSRRHNFLKPSVGCSFKASHVLVPDPHVFGPPGYVSGSISQRYGSGSRFFPFLIKVLSGMK